MAKRYERQSFDAVRQAERQRLRELEALGAEFGQGDDTIRGWFDSGSDPDAIRADLSARAAEHDRHAAATRVERVEQAAGHDAVAVALFAFGRGDLAGAYVEEHGLQGVPARLSPGEAFARLSGVRGPGVDAMQAMVVAFSAAGGRPGAVTASQLTTTSAVDRAAWLILRHEWGERSAGWRALCRPVSVPTFRSYAVYLEAAKGAGLRLVQESGTGEAVDAVAVDAVAATATIKVVRRLRYFDPSWELVHDDLLEAAGAWLAAEVAAEVEALSVAAVEAVLATGVAQQAGGFTAANVRSAVDTLNGQTLAGRVISTGRRPIAVGGRGREDFRGGAVPAASGDESAPCSGFVPVPWVADKAMVVSAEYLPALVGFLNGRDEPTVAFGAFAGVRRGAVGGENGLMAAPDNPAGGAVAWQRSEPVRLSGAAGVVEVTAA